MTSYTNHKEIFYKNIDLAKNILFNARIHPLTTEERTTYGTTLTSNDDGIIIYDSTVGNFFSWNGTDWNQVGSQQVQSDWNQSDNTHVDYIKNKPSPYTLPIANSETLGGVIIGSGISITDGVISVSTNTLSQILSYGNITDEHDIVITSGDRIVVGTNRAGLGRGTFDNGLNGDNGVSLYCAAPDPFELNFQAGYIRLIRQSSGSTSLPLTSDSELIYSSLVSTTPSSGLSLVTKNYVNSLLYITSVANSSNINLSVTTGQLTASFISNNISQFTNDSSYLTSISGLNISELVNNVPYLISSDLSGFVPYTGATANVDLAPYNITASQFIVYGGTGDQFLKANGSLDSNTYLTTSTASSTYLPLAGGTLSGDVQQPTAPVNGTSLITKNYVDNIIIGVIWVGADTDSTSNITLSGEQTINGVTTSNSRVFVHGQTNQTQNGIYISSSGAWSRSSDASTSAQIIKLAVLIEGGTNKGQQWINTNSTITLGTTNITFGQNFGIIYGAGTGLLLSGTSFTIDSSYTASTSITGYLSSTDWSHFNTAYTNRITSLTTTGDNGAATLASNTLNIPNYTLSGLGGQPLNTNLTSLSGLTYSSLGFVKMSASGVFSLDTNSYLTGITGLMVTTALGFTPYNSTNPSNYISLTALSSTATGLTYTNTTGVFSLTSGYLIPTTTSYNNTNWDIAYTQTRQWDGGSIGLVATTGRTSLGLGTWSVKDYPTYVSGTPFIKMTGTGTFSLDTSTYITGASGSNGQIQFNNSGAFGGDSGLLWDNTNKILSTVTTTPEIRLTTSGDSYYSRLQRSITNNTTYLKAQTTQVGGYGNAISLNGTSYYSATDAGLPSGTKPVISISVWCTVAAAVVLRYGNTNVVGIFSNMFNSSSGFASVSTAIVTGGSGGSNGSWVHYAMTCDGTTTKYYVNGALASSFTTSWVVDLGGQLTTQGIAGISSNNYTGKQTQILIYNTALPATGTNSISSIYNGGAGNSSIPTSGLLRRYDFASITSNTTPDTNPNGTQYPLSLFSSPTLVTGQVPTVSSIVEGIPIQYQDGFNANELGTLYLGDPNSGTWLRGQSVKTLIGSTIPFIIGTNSNVLISPANTSQSNTSQSTLANSPLTVIGGASIGSYTVAAPTNGLIVSGNVGIGKSSVTTNYNLSLVGNQDILASSSTNALSGFILSNSNSLELFRIFNGGNVSIGGNTASSLFQIYQPTTGIGTVTTSGTTITGTNTQFTNTFKVGDTIQLTISSPAWSSSTAYTIGQAVTNGGSTYLVTTAGTGGTGPTGGSSVTSSTQFGGAGAYFVYAIFTISAIASDTSMTTTTLPTIASATAYTLTGGNRFNVYGNGNVVYGSTSNMWYDARYGALNIGYSTSQSTNKLVVGGSAYITGTLACSTFVSSGGGSTYSAIDLGLNSSYCLNLICRAGPFGDPTKGAIAFQTTKGGVSGTAYEVGRISNLGNFILGTTAENNVQLQLTGYNNTKSGTGYHDFLSVTSTYGSVTNGSKWFRLNSTGGIEIINSAFTTTIFTLSDTGKIISNDVIRLKGYTVATLPTGTQGDTAYVTDALVPTFMGIISGGGSTVARVFYNGTNWIAS